jgi:hypothetical protein
MGDYEFKDEPTGPTPVKSVLENLATAGKMGDLAAISKSLLDALSLNPNAKINAITDAEKAKAAAGDAPAKTAVKNAVDGDAADVLAAKNTLKTFMGELTARSLDEFIVGLRLNDDAKTALATEIEKKSTVKGATRDNVVARIRNLKHAASKFPLEGLPAPTDPEAYIAKMNPYAGLHLGLLNPAFAEIVKEVRKRNNRLAVARPATGLGFPGFFGGPGLRISFPGMTGGALDALNMNFPIEMRGGGYDIAMQRGGNGMGLLGWRPITDSSFISLPLKQAFNQLRATLAAQEKKLDGSVETKVNQLLADLVAVEQKIKVTREELNTVTAAVVSGSVRDSDKITDTRLSEIAREYSDANKLRGGIENKLLNVVIELGKQSRTVSF